MLQTRLSRYTLIEIFPIRNSIGMSHCRESATKTVILETLANTTLCFLCDHTGEDTEDPVAPLNRVGRHINV